MLWFTESIVWKAVLLIRHSRAWTLGSLASALLPVYRFLAPLYGWPTPDFSTFMNANWALWFVPLVASFVIALFIADDLRHKKMEALIGKQRQEIERLTTVVPRSTPKTGHRWTPENRP